MSMKQHELNILKNVLEKAEGISERLQKWAGDLTDFIKQEIAEDEAKLAKLNAQSSIGADGCVNPLTGGAGAVLVGAGAIVANGAELQAQPAEVAAAQENAQAPAPSDPVTPVEAPVEGNGASAPDTSVEGAASNSSSEGTPETSAAAPTEPSPVTE